jgi:hypothetical protein
VLEGALEDWATALMLISEVKASEHNIRLFIVRTP